MRQHKEQSRPRELPHDNVQSYVDEVDLKRAVFRHTGFGEDGDYDKRSSLVPVIPAQRLSERYISWECVKMDSCQPGACTY